MHVKKNPGVAEDPLVEVTLPLPVHQTFTYSVPESLKGAVKPGIKVLVSFGKRRLGGYVLGPAKDEGAFRIKPLLEVLDPDPLFPPDMIPFFKWIADYYLHPVGHVLDCALPSGIAVQDLQMVSLTEKGRRKLALGDADPEALQILGLLKNGAVKTDALKRALKDRFRDALLSRMEKQGVIQKERVLKGPAVGFKQERTAALVDPLPSKDGLSGAKKKVLSVLEDLKEAPARRISEKAANASRHLLSLEKQGFIRIYPKIVYRDPFGEPVTPDRPHPLTGIQETAVAAILSHLGKGYRTFLLAGVTGSGKTEVYMHLAARVLEQGRSVLVLVPEIALISQMERRFRARFGDRVAVLHSGLSRGERHDQWMRILKHEAHLAIGARSAIFAPLEAIGCIIVDEEHDPSYKQETDLRYNARDLAVVRAMLQQTVAVLGSATPSIQSHYNVRIKKFTGLELPHRIEERPLPEVTVVDLKESRHRRGAWRFLTEPLITAMRETLQKKEQTLLFLNRRGFAGFPVCHRCGKPVLCRDCDISLTYHKADNLHACHYCGHTRKADEPCALCGSGKIKNLGMGTEKLEAAVKALFPDAAVARMDGDTTRKKGALVALLKGLKTGAIDILVGTQIVAKGHDFPNITLVGIICADLSLSFPDFRASERTFQVLAQVSGRAGRGDRPGRVILQTFNPDHFSITAARKQDFKGFYHQEIRFRKALDYPPFSHIVALKIWGKNKEKTRQWARTLGNACRNHGQSRKNPLPEGLVVLGPVEAPLTRIAGNFRWQILLKSRKVTGLNRFVSELLLEDPRLRPPPGVQVAVDVDPYDLM